MHVDADVTLLGDDRLAYVESHSHAHRAVGERVLGRFDLDMLQRDFAVARAMPGRHMAGIYLREDGDAVGVIDWMEENPSNLTESHGSAFSSSSSRPS